MTVEEIGKVVADIRAGRARRFPSVHESLNRLGDATASDGPVVDATAIYTGLVEKDTPVAVYEDHPCIAPPWPTSTICYRNEHGNVIAVAVAAEDYRNRDHSLWATAEKVDWERVRWVTTALVYMGGRGATGPFPTLGPIHLWRHAVYGDGSPADLFWAQLVEDYPMERWNMAQLTLLGALNFLGCRNVDIAEPRRSRAETRRLARTGVSVSEIVVFPAGRSTRRDKTPGVPVGASRLTKVRGHFAHYGPDYGKGLLFGKYAGRFWHPAHAYGDETVGEAHHDYTLRTAT